MGYSELVIARAIGDRVYSVTGVEYTDLFCGCGTVLLGHCEPLVTEALRQQIERVWNVGAFQSDRNDGATRAIARFFPDTHWPAALYSTGAEAAEFALRVARVHSGRSEFVGFEGSMHGKSMAAAELGWFNEGVRLPKFHRLPYVPHASEDEILNRAAAVLETGAVAAVFIEAFQASAGGHLASPTFFQTLGSLCRTNDALLVVDEIFTGFHRMGPAFLYPTLRLDPDVVLVGKAMGNGFPVSAVVLRRSIDVTPAMLPSSTFAGNPLAAVAVEATLERMRSLDLPGLVGRVHSIVDEELGELRERGVALRGQGALWVLEFTSAAQVARAVDALATARVLVSRVGSCLRILPPASIDEHRLRVACRSVRQACSGSA